MAPATQQICSMLPGSSNSEERKTSHLVATVYWQKGTMPSGRAIFFICCMICCMICCICCMICCMICCIICCMICCMIMLYDMLYDIMYDMLMIRFYVFNDFNVYMYAIC